MMDINSFNIDSLESEIAVDHHCAALLKQFHANLLNEGIEPLDAGQLAHGADYFLREFIIGTCRENLFDIAPVRIRQFAGHWYIIKTLEPNLKELTQILQGVAIFYTYLHQQNKIDISTLEKIKTYSTDIDFYRRRIESFWDIEGDGGYPQWCQDCPLPDCVSTA
nr:hypothetical protein [uncultured Desulfuromonas sp.]